jgi:hypothetical protein
MAQNKRKHQRRHFERVAWAETAPGSRTICSVTDISEKGARLGGGEIETLPDSFVLLFTADAKVARKCRVAWRQDGEIGVRFVDGPARNPLSIVHLSC